MAAKHHTILKKLRVADGADVPAALADLLAKSDTLDHDEALVLLRDVDALLEDRGELWGERRVLADKALTLVTDTPSRGEWLGRAAVAAFWLNEVEAAERYLTEARSIRDAPPKLRVRVLLVSGYLMDLRGQHARAEAWYRQALAVAPPTERARVLLEIGTSLSKQGRYADALAVFTEAELQIGPPSTRSGTPILCHIFSRRAVVHEIMNDFVEAERLQRQALALAEEADDRALQFTVHCRLVRTHIASGKLDLAHQALVEAERYVGTARRGRLFLSSDWARYWRAKGDWEQALEAYRTAIGELPEDSNRVLSAHLDDWGQLLDGIEECLRRLDREKDADVIRRARDELRTLRDARGIYDDQVTTQQEARQRITRLAADVRSLALDARPQTFTSHGYTFDLQGAFATPIAGGAPVPLGEIGPLLRLLMKHLNSPLSKATILETLRAEGHPGLTWEAVRQRVRELRRRLNLTHDELIAGARGRGAGGYSLILEAPKTRTTTGAS